MNVFDDDDDDDGEEGEQNPDNIFLVLGTLIWSSSQRSSLIRLWVSNWLSCGWVR
jgi:hypothetical protein